MQTSTRRGISYPSLDRSDRPDVPAHIKNLIDALELDIPSSQGSFASRPANPGYARWIWWSTDQNIMSYWDGANWHDVGTANVIAQTLVDAKGDLLVGLADNVVGRLGVGTNAWVLTADNTQASGMKWQLDPLMDLAAAKGDILAATGVDAFGRVAVGADGKTLVADAAQATGVKWATPQLNFKPVAQLGADVPMPTANTFYDGPSISLGASGERWLLQGTVTISNTDTNNYLTVKLWDGTTVYASTEVAADGNTIVTASLVGITPALSGAITAKISVAPKTSSVDPVIKAACVDNSAGNNASTLTAVQLL